MIQLRPEVQKFAEAMELKLRKNDHKGGWKKCKAADMFYRASKEFREADEELALFLCEGHKDPQKALGELADTANFLMMVADIIGGLRLEHDA